MRLTFIVFALFSATASAAPAVEGVAENTIKLRGQGPNPWCFAFAEEQLLKDQACMPKGCPANASQWSISIFDIVKAHTQVNAVMSSNLVGRDGNKLTRNQLFFSGSAKTLPYAKLNITALRASKCTLEQPLLRMNRSSVLNPSRANLYDHLVDIHKKIKAGGANSVYDADQQNELRALGIQALMGHLERLSKQAVDGDAFVAKVIDFTSCADQVQIPKIEFESKVAVNEAAIRFELSELLNAKKSVLLGVCAEILEDEKSTASCGGHAVVAKELKANRVLIVDSAFFSPEKKNADGSAWVPLENVVKATAKFGLRLQKSGADFEETVSRLQREFDETKARLKKEMEESIAGLADQSGYIEPVIIEMMVAIREMVATIPPSKIKETIIKSMTEMPDGEKNNVDEIFIADVLKLDIRSQADVEKIEPLIRAYMKRLAEPAIQRMRDQANGVLGDLHISWPTLESSSNMTWFK